MSIPQTALDAWAQHAPWPNPLDVEQDLLLSRLIVDIANHPLLGTELAFRGGTALHKLHAAQPWRYSNDLDYVRTSHGPVGELMDEIRMLASGAGLTEKDRKTSGAMVTQRFDGVPTGGLGRLRVKIEVNISETVPLFGHVRVPYAVTGAWFSGTAEVLGFELDELLGTKLRALHQRRKGRDLFDLWLGLNHLAADPDRIVAALHHYIDRAGTSITAGAFTTTLTAKLEHSGFLGDLHNLVRTIPEDYNPPDAAAQILQVFGSRLR